MKNHRLADLGRSSFFDTSPGLAALALSATVAAGALSVPGCATSNAASQHRTDDAATPSAVVHTVVASAAGLSVNAYLVEGPRGVVAVDSALTNSDAAALRKTLDALHKPLLAVVLTHGHPDHYNGVSALIAGLGEIPIYATPEVARVIRTSDAAKEAQWKPVFGAEWPATRSFPNAVAPDGQPIVLDGLRFTVHAVGPGESHADSYWVMEDARGRVAFIGDLVLHGEHAYVSDGHTAAWLAHLGELTGPLSAMKTLYPGHGAAGGKELLTWQRGYLETFRRNVEGLRQGGDHLDDKQKAALTQAMKAAYPSAGLDFLIALGADPVAKEMATAQ